MISLRLVLLCAAGLALSCAAWAGPREDSLAGIARCPAGLDDHAYLDCIYGAVQPLRASLGLVPAPAAQQRLVPMPAAAQAPAISAPPAQGSGLLGRLLGPANADLHMTAYSFDKHGLMTVTLSNGEVWQQLASDTSFAQLGARASDYTVSLVADNNGESRMSVHGETGSFAMRRIR